MQDFSDYQNLPSSEKITLAIVDGRTRLVGWVVHSGSVYKITDFDKAVVKAIEDSGNAYVAVTSVGAVTAGKYFHDRTNEILYLRATDSSNPNGRFLVLTTSFFFANVPIALPYDLVSGYEVFFEPLVKTTSEFGVEIDTVKQISEALEGSGTLTLINDHDFWPTNFDKYIFENQRCVLYSYHRDLDLSEKKLIFKGKVEKKAYTKDAITFQLKDQFAELRNPLSLATIGALGARTDENLNLAYQRMILGRVFGNRPTNIDRVLDGYPITGTVAIAFGSAVLTGTGTSFLSKFSPSDSIVLPDNNYTIQSVDSNTQMTLTDDYAGSDITGVVALIVPDKPKRYINRVFQVCGHATKEPVTTISDNSSVDRLFVASTTDIYVGDTLYVGTLGSGELTKVDSVIGSNYLKITPPLASVPTIGTQVLRPAIQNVRIDGVLLSYYRDYTFNAATGVLTLRTTAESDAAPIYSLPNNITFTNGSSVVSGTGFKGTISPGYMLGVVGNAIFFEVLSIDSDTQVTLRTNSSFTATNIGRYKSLIYDEGKTTLSVDMLGITDDGTTSGVLLKTGPSINKFLLTQAGLAADLNVQSFSDAEEIAYQHIGMVIPTKFDDTSLPIYRDVLNDINKSMFGSLVQNVDFEFCYRVLRPKKVSVKKFSESDILSFSLNSTAENIIKTAIIEYRPKEYNYSTNDASINTQQKSSDNASYILQTDRTKTISTFLVEEQDAEIAANRWAFILDQGTGVLEITTKMQGFLVEVGDVIEIEHRKFFERGNSSEKSKLALVQSVKRTGTQVTIEATDLSNSFNRVACINDFSNDWSTATGFERLYGGYYTDQYGLISNDQISFGTNLIW